MSEKEKPTYNVTSHHQSGGITAGQVNIGAQPRSLAEKLKRSALEIIGQRQGAPISVTAPLGDGEAFALATQLTEFLRAKGYEVKGVDQAVWNKPPEPLTVNPETDRIDFIIGSNR